VVAPLSVSTAAADAQPGVKPIILHAAQFGAQGDGKADDGPAVQRMLAKAAGCAGPVTLQFESRKRYFLKTGRNRYGFWINGAAGLTLDGGGSVFLIDSEQRFLSLTRSSRVVVRNFKVDYRPLPFADGLVIATDKPAGTIDVSIDEGEALPPPGGPTHEDGEQAYFGSLWRPGVYEQEGTGGAYRVRNNVDVHDVRDPGTIGAFRRVVRVQSNPNDPVFDLITPGVSCFSVPVRGIAHRYGSGETVRITANRDVTLENIEIWSAPWMAFVISENRGSVLVRRAAVRPPPGTTRINSSWRDAFHVKNNRASLLFEDCIVQGTGDDAFNIASHTSTVRELLSPTRIRISQNFPLSVAAMEPGDTLVFYSSSRGAVLGRAGIVRSDPPAGRFDRAPVFTIDLDAPVPGLAAGNTLLWNIQSSNPNTLLRRCRMDTSCRFRSPVTISGCRINALAWFTGDEIEAPIPGDIEVSDTQFRLGQGNPDLVLVVDGPHLEGHGPTEPVIDHVLFRHNRIWGDVSIGDADHVVLDGNLFADNWRHVTFHNVRHLTRMNSRMR
jgi:hypothetical protein